MPADQQGSVYKTSNGHGLRWYDETSTRRRRAGFASRSAARAWFRDVERPRIARETPTAPPLTLAEHVERYLDAHAVGRDPKTIDVLRFRLAYATRVFGELHLNELEQLLARHAAPGDAVDAEIAVNGFEGRDQAADLVCGVLVLRQHVAERHQLLHDLRRAGTEDARAVEPVLHGVRVSGRCRDEGVTVPVAIHGASVPVRPDAGARFPLVFPGGGFQLGGAATDKEKPAVSSGF